MLDTSDNKKITVRLRIDSKEYIKTQEIRSNKAQIVLSMIDKMLRKHEIKLENIQEIEVNTRLGSFTGIRVGLTIANALAFVLRISVKEVK